jgi:hypothetical protein
LAPCLKKNPEEVARDVRGNMKDTENVMRQLGSNPPKNNGISISATKKGIDEPHGHHLIAISAICLICIILFSNTLNSPFVFDDVGNIRENSYIRLTNFDFQRLSDACLKSPASNRPVANISFALNYYFGKYDVTGYHAVNIIIHLINGILVYFLALIIFIVISYGYTIWNKIREYCRTKNI